MLESVAGNPVVYQTRDTSIVSIVSYNQAGVVVKAKKVGSTTVVAQVDGVQTECVITVTNPQIKKAYGFYQKKKNGLLRTVAFHHLKIKYASNITKFILS